MAFADNPSGITMTQLGAAKFGPAVQTYVDARFADCVDVTFTLLRAYNTYVFQIDAHAVEDEDDGYPRKRFTLQNLLPRSSSPSQSLNALNIATKQFTAAPVGCRQTLWTRTRAGADDVENPVRRSSEIEAVVCVEVRYREDVDGPLSVTELDVLYVNYHCPVERATTFKPTRLSRETLAMSPPVRALEFNARLLSGCRDVYGGSAPMPVDATHAYVGACLVTLSEDFEVLDCLSGIVGVPDMQHVFVHDNYPYYHYPYKPALTSAEFRELYGFGRVQPEDHAYFWRAGPRF
jgi:hypothetical protein